MVNFEDFWNFVKEHFKEKKELITVTGKKYNVNYNINNDSLIYEIETGNIREHKKKWVKRVFERFLESKSYKTTDYSGDLTVHASYILPIVKFYKDYDKRVAILFSVDPEICDMNDVIDHLQNHKELYFNVGYSINKKNLKLPIKGYIYISKKGITYKVMINEILQPSEKHFLGTNAYEIKPRKWIETYNKSEDNSRSVYVFTKIEKLPKILELKTLKKENEEFVKQPPIGYMPIIDPDYLWDDIKNNIAKQNKQINAIALLLTSKKQIILYGPPGTGKTYKTKEYAVNFLKTIEK